MRIPLLTSLTEAVVKRRFRSDVAKKPMSMSVIISTYNNPAWLEKTFWGYLNQKFDAVPYEIVIADDGSDHETCRLIDRYRREFSVDVKHVWHPDEGFRKCRILNEAIKASDSEYLIFTDQDCVPRNDFLENHFLHAESGHYLSGGYVKLPMNVSQGLNRGNIEDGKAFQADWLKKNFSFSTNKLLPRLVSHPWTAMISNWLTTTSATCNGCSFSCWRKDLETVNGYNEEMSYGGLDRELGERLRNLGIRGKQLRYSLVCLHLDHERPYESRESWKRNRQIRHEIRRLKKIETDVGLRDHRVETDLEIAVEATLPIEGMSLSRPVSKKVA